MKCSKCGYDNDVDASFCEKCGTNLKTPAVTSNLTKVLIVVIIILVGVLGVVGGMMFFGNQTTPVNNTTIVINQTTQQSVSAEWHQIASFSGVNSEFQTFTTKGNKFKVVMKATPTFKNTSSYLTTDITDGYKIYNTGTISWSANASVTTEEKTLQATGPPGIYTLHIYSEELQGWSIIIYDYY